MPEFERDVWVLFNSFVVSWSSEDDARDFEKNCKEPCLVIYRSAEDDAEDQSFVSDNAADSRDEVKHSILSNLFPNGATNGKSY